MARTARAGVLLVAVLGLFGACGAGNREARPASVTSPPRPPAESTAPAASSDWNPTDDWSPAPLDWRDCSLPRGGQCAELAVPLDWADQERRFGLGS